MCTRMQYEVMAGFYSGECLGRCDVRLQNSWLKEDNAVWLHAAQNADVGAVVAGNWVNRTAQ